MRKPTETDPFDCLNKARPDEIAAFGSHWCGPVKFEMRKETLVARYESLADGDGQTCEVYCTAAPARFYTLKMIADKNSAGEPLLPWQMGTGSGCRMAELAANMAHAIADGMLSLHYGRPARKRKP